MKEALCFDDVLIKPKFSAIESRKDVNLRVCRLGLNLSLNVISANMDSITGSDLAIAMGKAGAVGALHRFWSVETNLNEFRKVFVDAGQQVMCSVGLGKLELERAEALVSAGCNSLIIDVAHGASMAVVDQVRELAKITGNDAVITVGNFATRESVRVFVDYVGGLVGGIKIGVGPGSRCSTRGVTGVGYPQLSAIIEITNELKYGHYTLIADGGMNSSGDIAKALGAGAHFVMSGSLFAGCDETPGEVLYVDSLGNYVKPEFFLARKLNLDGSHEYVVDKYSESFPKVKKYRGSASKESYEDQGKNASYIAPEGNSSYIPCKGSVAKVLQEIEGGLRSSFSYTNSKNLEEFHRNVEFVRVSSNTVVENGTRNDNRS